MDERKERYLNGDKEFAYARIREYQRWTPEDDELILADAEGVQDLHLAILLGRSIQAIQCRRSRLLKKKGEKQNVPIHEEDQRKCEI